MRDRGIFPYFFPYADDTICFLWYLMNNFRKIPELNDTKNGVLATNGQRYRNSNPSSSAIKNPTTSVVGDFLALDSGGIRTDLNADTVLSIIKNSISVDKT